MSAEWGESMSGIEEPGATMLLQMTYSSRLLSSGKQECSELVTQRLLYKSFAATPPANIQRPTEFIFIALHL